ncbi:hypothetical protein F4678DRAFT_362338 [Xylaria arbuscula]|nr:hypothetical protein F4678DRAFT_362338 [Xylaria arbuscula]
MCLVHTTAHRLIIHLSVTVLVSPTSSSQSLCRLLLLSNHAGRQRTSHEPATVSQEQSKTGGCWLSYFVIAQIPTSTYTLQHRHRSMSYMYCAPLLFRPLSTPTTLGPWQYCPDTRSSVA